MVALPAEIPVTIPVDALTIATAVLLLLQLPPVMVDENVALLSTQICWLPLTIPADGAAVTNMFRLAVAGLQPPSPATVYVMEAVPADIPVTIPKEASMVATDKLLLLHTPPVTVEVSVDAPPVQRVWIPESVPAEGGAETFNTRLASAPGQPPAPGTE